MQFYLLQLFPRKDILYIYIMLLVTVFEGTQRVFNQMVVTH